MLRSFRRPLTVILRSCSSLEVQATAFTPAPPANLNHPSQRPHPHLHLPQNVLWYASKGSKHAKKSKGKKMGHGHDEDNEDEEDMKEDDTSGEDEFDLAGCRRLMDQAIEHYKHELAGVRTGRATTGLIDSLPIQVDNDRVPLKALGTVTVRGSQTLVVTLYDPTTVEAVKKGIKTSPLGLNPTSEGGEVLATVPRMTKETIDMMVKLVKAEAEEAKVSLRNARHKGIDMAKRVLKTMDEKRRGEKEVHTMYEKYVAEIDRLKQAKDKELTEHL